MTLFETFFGNHQRKRVNTKKPITVRMAGSLAPYAAGYREHLARQGYRSTTTKHLCLMAQISRWLTSRGLDTDSLTLAGLEEFSSWREDSGYVTSLSIHSAALLCDYLVGVGVITRVGVVVAERPFDEVVLRYRRYLNDERGLSASSVAQYVKASGHFLQWLYLHGDVELRNLNADILNQFIFATSQRVKTTTAGRTIATLRSLLWFFYLEGITPTALAPAVLSVAPWRQSELPKALDAKHVVRLLKSCDRRTASGRRDFAILMLLSRLGLRAREVAGLQLNDIDWRQGELVVRGKGHREDRLPLPRDVGEALVTWLERGRPRCACRSVFVRACVPFREISASGVSAIVRRACGRIGLSPVGAHCLRHTTATRILQAGGSLAEVAQVLRHRSQQTTAHYAKVDRLALVAVVRSWPGGGA